MSLEGYVWKFPGRGIVLHNDVEASDASGFATVLDAVDALRDGWEPLSSEAVVTCVTNQDDNDVRPRTPHWLLSRSGLPAEIIIASRMIDPVTSQVEVLSRPVLDAWLSGALAECARQQPNTRAEWRELYFAAGRARVGPVSWGATESALQLRTDAGTLIAPLERDDQGTWLSGPRDPAFDQAPLALAFHQQWGALKLRISVNFSFWLEQGEPAAAWLEAALARLEALRWERA